MTAWVDVRCSVGTELGPARGADAPALVEEATAAGIGACLVSRIGASITPQLGNDRLLEVCAEYPSLCPVVTARPYRLEGHARQLAGWARAGAAAVMIDGSLFEPEGLTATRSLLADVASAGMPLVVPLSAVGQASAVGRMTAAFGLSVVLGNLAYHLGPDAFMAARHHEHLLIETSRLLLFDQLERVCALLGSERVLLGSGAPGLSPVTAVTNVMMSSLQPAEKLQVLGGNAHRYLGIGAPAALEQLPEPVVLPAGTVDVHTHTDVDGFDVPWLDAAAFAARQREIGVVGSAASSLLAITGDVMAGNERLARSAAAGDVLGYLVTDPADPLSRTRDQIERYGATDGVVGAKIHCQWSRTHTAEHQVSELFAVLAGWGRPVKIHIDGADWDAALATLAMRHPALKIIVAHTGPGLPSTKVIPLASRHENLFIEFSSSMATPDVVRRIAAKVPREQVLFGTDAPLLSVGASLGTYLTAGLGPDVAPEVYTTNWRSVFG